MKSTNFVGVCFKNIASNSVLLRISIPCVRLHNNNNKIIIGIYKNYL